MLLVADAPLDDHTAALLRRAASADSIVTSDGPTAGTLRGWAEVARRCEGRLVVVDSGLRAESQALANLLDDPAVHTAVLLAHNGDDSANPIITVAHGRLVPGGDGVDRSAAGILVVANRDCPAFADAVQRAARVAESGRSGASAWEIAVRALRDAASVQAVEAAPFCASRSAMDLPDRGEDDRRLRATAAADDDLATRFALRPLSRRFTRLAIERGWSPSTLTWAGLGAGAVAALAAIATVGIGKVSWVAGALGFLVANLLLLSDGELARYWRRPTAAGARQHRLATRGVEVLVLFGLAMASAGSGTPAWLLTATALGLLAVNAHAVAARAAVGDDRSSSYRGLRWLLVSIAWLFAGPGWALLLFAMGALAVVGQLTVRAMSDLRAPQSEPDRIHRFVTPPGAFTDAGAVIRALSGAVTGRLGRVGGTAFGVGVAAICFGSVWSWGGGQWPMLLAVLVLLVGAAAALAGPLAGPHAWAVPPLLRGVEVATIVTIASSLPGSGRIAGAALAAGMYLLTSEALDRWRDARVSTPAWLVLADLGFDGRMLLLALAGAFAATGATVLAWVLAALLLGLWVLSIRRFPRLP